jgi:threonine dehydrogenase-like Zn-dependent dehydrogenase
MRGAVMYAPGDVRVEERDDPRIVEPADAVVRLSAGCICGSDLWPYRGVEKLEESTPMGHEYAGVVEEVEFVRVPLADGTLVATPEQPSRDLIASLLAASDVLGTEQSMMQAIGSTRPGGHTSYVGVPYDVQLPGVEMFSIKVLLEV